MLYQEYKEKLNRLRRILDGLYKCRLLILAGVILLLAACGALMGIKGMAYDFSLSSSTLTYGQSISATAECIFGEAEFEYRAVGDKNWSKEKPIYAGKYECRPVSRSIVGSKRGGKPLAFEILPAKVEVNVYGSQLRYGDDLVFSAELKYGDRLEVSDYELVRNNGKFEVSFSPDSVYAYSKAGRDVTSSYVFLPKDKTLRIDKRAITITMPTESIEYDGESHTFDTPSVSGLLAGHSVEVKADSFSEAGSYRNIIRSYKIFDENGEDITEIYSANCVAGSVQITPRQITLGATPKDIIYDGEEHIYDEYELLDGTMLAGGQELRLGNFNSGIEAGSYQHSAQISIFDGDRDVTRNYRITRRFAPMTILPRPIIAFTGDVVVEYSGSEFSFDSSIKLDESTPLITTHSLQVISNLKAIYAGEYDNKPTLKIVDASGRDVTRNYDIDFECGSVTIRKASISVSTISYDVFYSGETNIPYPEENAININEGLLKGNDSFKVLYGDLTMIDANESGYQNSPEIDIVNELGVSVKDSYDISFSYGTVRVMRRTLEVKTASNEFEYDGNAHGDTSFELADIAGDGEGLVEGHSLSVAGYPTVKNFSDSGRENRLEFAVKDGGRDVSDNYIINCTYGTLNILKRPLKLATASGSNEYNGRPFELDIVEVDGMMAGSNFAIDDIVRNSFISDVGEADNDFEFSIHILYEGVETTDNYYIDGEVALGKLSITPRKVRFATGSGTFIYNAQPRSATTLTCDRLVEGHSASVEVRSYIEASSHINAANVETLKITDEGGRDVTANYQASWEYGNILIERRPIAIVTPSLGIDDKLYYDGLPHSLGEFSLADDGALVDGHEIALNFEPHIAAGRYTNSPSSWSITEDGTDVSKNYVLKDCIYGEIVISKRKIKISTHSLAGVIYDGEPHGASGYDLIIDSEYLALADGQDIELGFASWTDAGSYKNIPTSHKISADGRDVSQNYDVSYSYGGVEILKRKLTLTAKSESFIYDGVSHIFGVDTLAVEGELAASEELNILSAPSFMNAGSYENLPSVRVYSNRTGAYVQDKNYDITLIAGEIDISRREILIVTSRKSVFYSGYDNTPAMDEAIESALLQGEDRIVVDYSDIVMIEANEDGYVNSPKIDIVNAAGFSAYDNYIVSTEYGKIVVMKRHLSVYSDDISLEYNGEYQGKGEVSFKIVVTSYEGEGLAAGQRLKVENLAELKACGVRELELVFAVLRQDESDATANYTIDISGGRLSILQRDISLRTKSASKAYDGTPLMLADVEILSGLVDGHSYVCHPLYIPSITNYMDGPIDNKFEFALDIFDESGEDVTNNYDTLSAYASVEYGKLTIFHRLLVLSTDDLSVTYDAEEHGFSYDDLQISRDGLAPDQRLEITFNSFVDADTYEDVCSGYKVYFGDVDVTENYYVSANFGNVIILARNVTLTLGSEENIVYDGRAHGVRSYTETQNTLVTGHALAAIDGELAYPEFEDVGTYANSLQAGSWTIVDSKGMDVGRNYEITLVDGKISIIRRRLTVQIASDTDLVYDGVTHRINDFVITSELNLEDIGQSMTITCKQFFDAGDYVNYLLSADSYVICKADGSEVDKNNFNITWLAGAVKIAKRPITVRLPDTATLSWIYDGDCHLSSDVEVEEGMLEWHSVILQLTTPPTEAGEYTFGEGELKYTFGIKRFNMQSVEKNFEVVDLVKGGKLNIFKRKVAVTTASATQVYLKGTHLTGSVDEKDIEAANGERGMLANHFFAVLAATSIEDITDIFDPSTGKYTAAGYMDNIVTEYRITDDSGVDRTEDYEIEWQSGRLRIKAPVEVYVYSHSKSYDGNAVTLGSGYKIKSLPYGVEEGDVHIELVGSLLKPGVVTLREVTEASRLVSTVVSRDMSDNRIDFIGPDNVIEITKRRITIKTNSAHLKKADEPIYGRDYGYTIVGRLIGDDSLSFDISGVLGLDETSVPNAVDMNSIRIVNGLGEDMLDCYEVVVEAGTLSWMEE